MRGGEGVVEEGTLGLGRKGRNRLCRGLWGRFCGAVHLTTAGDEPVQIKVGVMAGGALDEIEARFVASGEDVRDAGAGDADGVRELRLADVFGREKLLQTTVHFSNPFVYKSNKNN